MVSKALFSITFMRVHLSAWRWDEKLFKKSDFYYENYDFQDEKQVLYNCPKMALRAKILFDYTLLLSI